MELSLCTSINLLLCVCYRARTDPHGNSVVFSVLSTTAGKQKVFEPRPRLFRRLLFDCVVRSVRYQVNRMISNLRIYVLQAGLFAKTYMIIRLFIVCFASFVANAHDYRYYYYYSFSRTETSVFNGNVRRWLHILRAVT